MCIEIAPKSLAMYKLEEFRVIEVLEGTEVLRDQLMKTAVAATRPPRGSAGNLIGGRTYRLRWVLSSETWGQLEQAYGLIFVNPEELEVSPNTN
jgi:hypothetical protein